MMIAGVLGTSLAADPPVSQEMPRRIGPMPGGAGRDLRSGASIDPRARSPIPTDSPAPVQRIDLRAVEPRTSDRGPLDAGLRWVQPGLQLPSGYRQVYRLEGGGFMRADGGLAATFDQSVYQPSAQGEIPVIPASTLFVIGGVPLGAEPGHGRLLAVDPLDPGAVPSPFAPTATPDASRDPSATPGDRWRRFGFGAGYRMPDRIDPEGHEGGVDVSGSRFLRDQAYRAARLADRLAAWRAASKVVSESTPGPVSPNSSADSTKDATRTPASAATATDPAP